MALSSTDNNTGSDPPAEICPCAVKLLSRPWKTQKAKRLFFCESTCQKWLHSWCAGVHKESYAPLLLSEEPFMCPLCRLSEHCQLKQCKLFPPTRGNSDIVGKHHDQEASGVNVSGVESGLETEPASSKAVTNDGASAKRS